MRVTNRYQFTKGEVMTLDRIYTIQGLGGSLWWEHCPDPSMGEGDEDFKRLPHSSDWIIITRDIRITVTVS